MKNKLKTYNEKGKLIGRLGFLVNKNNKGEFKTVESFIKFVNNDKSKCQKGFIFSTAKHHIGDFLKKANKKLLSGEINNVKEFTDLVNKKSYSLLAKESHDGRNFVMAFTFIGCGLFVIIYGIIKTHVFNISNCVTF